MVSRMLRALVMVRRLSVGWKTPGGRGQATA